MLNTQIPQETIEIILARQRLGSTYYGDSLPYDDWDICKSRLQSGIEAIKHNYSNSETQTVRIWFSKDMQTLHYRSLEPKGFGCFTNTRSIRLKTIAGHVYGASTKTFYSKRHTMVSRIREAAVKRISVSRSSKSSDNKGRRRKSILSLTDPFEEQLG